jgi:hypothetical protein
MRFLKLTAAIAIGAMPTCARAADIKVICSNGFAAVTARRLTAYQSKGCRQQY